MNKILHTRCAKKNSTRVFSHPFNLLELMVVVLVIAIIAAFILASLSRAREYAMQASCANNLHQIAIAHQSYKSEYKFFPRPYAWLDDFRPVHPFIQSYKVFTCPGKYPKTQLTSIEDLNGGTDYYVCTINEFKDLELNGPTAIDAPEDDKKDNPSDNNGNAGIGNNLAAYFYDPSNPKFERVAADKLKIPLIYDRYGPAHFSTINVSYIDDTRTGTMRDMCFIWTLDKQDTLFIDAVTPWPNI
jgi:type II secretory pathway pseudopilin PulG